MLTTDNIEFVILAAGKSTRNYPHSKGIPHKSLIPFGSRKVIDYIIKELLNSGAKHITIVCSDTKAKEAFQLCFTRERNIEEKFKKNGNIIGLELLQSLYIPDDIQIKYVIQHEPKGLGHAIGLANKQAQGRHLVVRMPDDIVISTKTSDRSSTVSNCIKQYINDNRGGNIFITRQVQDPSRWGIIDEGIFKEKPTSSKSNEAFHTMAILDSAIGKKLEEIATLIDMKDTPEYNAWQTKQTEVHFDKYLNEEISKNPETMSIRTFPIQQSDTYLDCGTLKGYEEALLYTLLKESVYKENNRKTAQILLTDCLIEECNQSNKKQQNNIDKKESN